MAEEEKTNIDLLIDTAQSQTNIKGLNKSLKDLVSAQGQVDKSSPDFKKLQKAITDTEGKVGDLTDAFQTLKGEGVERLSSSFNLMKEGFGKWDTGKIKTGLQGIGGAMKAIPIMAIISAITYLIENFDELSKGTGLLGKTLRLVGDAITWVTDKIYEFTDAIGLTNSELDKQAEAMVKNADKSKEALEKQTNEYDNLIAAAKAAGKSTTDLEIAKQIAIQKTNDAIIAQGIAWVKSGKELTEEQKKVLEAAVESNKQAVAQITVIKNTATKEEQDKAKEAAQKWKKDQEEKKKIEEKAAIDHAAYLKEREKLEEESQANISAQLEYSDNYVKNAEQEKLDAKLAADAQKLVSTAQTAQSEIDSANNVAANDAKNWEEKKAKMKETFQLAQQFANATIQIVNQVNDLQNQKRENELKAFNEQKQSEIDTINANLDAELAKEGLTEQQKVDYKNKAAQDEYQLRLQQYNQNIAVKKKEFENQKKISIATALIAGAVGAVNALSATPAPYAPIIAMALATITTALSIAKIRSQQFDAGGAPPKPPTLQTAASSANIGGGSNASANQNKASFLPPGLQKIGDNQGQFNPPGSGQGSNGNDKDDTKKIYVVADDISKQQNKSEILERRASFNK